MTVDAKAMRQEHRRRRDRCSSRPTDPARRSTAQFQRATRTGDQAANGTLNAADAQGDRRPTRALVDAIVGLANATRRPRPAAVRRRRRRAGGHAIGRHLSSSPTTPCRDPDRRRPVGAGRPKPRARIFTGRDRRHADHRSTRSAARAAMRATPTALRLATALDDIQAAVDQVSTRAGLARRACRARRA